MNKCLLSIHNLLGSVTHDIMIVVSETDKAWFSWSLTSSKERQVIRELHKLILLDGAKYYEDNRAGFWDSEWWVHVCLGGKSIGVYCSESTTIKWDNRCKRSGILTNKKRALNWKSTVLCYFILRSAAFLSAHRGWAPDIDRWWEGRVESDTSSELGKECSLCVMREGRSGKFHL